MSLRRIGTVSLPPHAEGGGFDHAAADRSADRLYVAHTANDAVEVIDLDRLHHEATLQGLPGVAGAATWEGRGLLVATCRGEATVGLAALAGPATIRSTQRVRVGARPNGLALAPGTGLALAACLGDPEPPSLAMIDLERGAVLATALLPGRPRWAVHDENAGCFYVNVAAPAQIVVVRAAQPFDTLRSIPDEGATPTAVGATASSAASSRGSTMRSISDASSRARRSACGPGGPTSRTARPARRRSECGCGQIIRRIRAAKVQGVAVEEVAPGDLDAVRRCGVTVVPTVVFLDAAGEIVARREGESAEVLAAISADLSRLEGARR